MLAFLPAAVLGAFWIGGQLLLILVALGLPAIYLLAGMYDALPRFANQDETDVIAASALPGKADEALEAALRRNAATACLLVEIEDMVPLVRRWGEDAAEAVRDRSLARLRGMLRDEDQAFRIGDARLAVVLAPAPRLDLEILLSLAKRVQTGLEEPIGLDHGTHYLSVAVGFCGASRLKPGAQGAVLVDCAQTALDEALANGPSAIRAWSDAMVRSRSERRGLLADVERALVSGQIQPWFQPQVCTSTGRISGVEALARWLHPERGIVPPLQFLQCLEEAGQMDKLGEVILQHSLTALRTWDQAGIDIPRVSVNFSGTELRNPQLVERVKWELDRFGLTPQRLGVEVLETVISEAPEGIVARNIRDLGDLGCHIDLDDFGTGHASITALRRFSVHRLKIDRSFVTRVDRDEDQRRMLAAVLGLAGRLGLETLAEGVESVGEHALLAQLGCDHVQGFGIARPMTSEAMVDWARSHAERIADAQWAGRQTG
ncbi:GGDEF domain-containing phosphodiesterase [Thalassococcus sp. CAU 1522]|uniref:GGDEF domain-containing phosphodiesterase n=2 Tax=Thalassococcus arenae TaxID=2851652 RepID=A0ABS6N797_9RHOB|nr:GGDEF domain-containing phosphodiesterase [Thalassococcus arenae]